MSRHELLFLDTSVLIARLLHGPAQRQRVEARAGSYLRGSGLVCRQEFKRRVLKTAAYLLGQLDERGGCENTHAYMTRLIQIPHHKRRATICLGLLAAATGADDSDKTDRLRARLRTLILTGLAQFDDWLDAPAGGSGCGCGRDKPHERRARTGRTTYEFGTDRCAQRGPGGCGVDSFLADRALDRGAVLAYLRGLPPERKTAELSRAEDFLVGVESNPQSARSRNPCLEVGDLIIALESAAAGAAAFYTMNGRESQHLCRALGQTLIVRPPDPSHDDVVCERNDPTGWRDFG
jgi:hypothetical protein